MKNLDWRQVVSGLVVGALLAGFGMWYEQGQRTAVLVEKVNSLQNQITDLKAERRSDRHGTPVGVDIRPERDPEAVSGRLLEIIREQQYKHVKQSSGELPSQCFTDQDLDEFVASRTAERVAVIVGSDNRFLETVIAIKMLSPADRQRLLHTGAKLSRPTWGELGRISAEGQTDAGHAAELMIAESIVNLARELAALPVAEIERRYVD